MSGFRSPTLARVVKGELCSGCGLCAGVAPEAVALGTVAPGYTRPIQNAPVSAESEGKIAAACPRSAVAPWQNAPVRHPYWGPAHQILVGYATDGEVRHAGSSGAAITGLALHALETGLVEGVLHVSADPDLPTRNIVRISNSAADVVAGAGSRYAASSPLADMDALLTEGRRIAFIGKPCDVSALRMLARLDPRVDLVFPIKFAFFCAGVPSHDGADRIIRQMGMEPEEVVAFRYRGNGWPGLTRAETVDKHVAEMRYADSWGGQLSKEVQFRCKICPDAIGGVADIACADAWYGEDGYPSFEEREGRSLIMVRTEAGERLIASARAATMTGATPPPR